MKVLFYDIESSPIHGYTWGRFETNVIAIKQDWKLMSFAYKWLNEKGVVCESVRTARSERALVKKLHKVLSEADIVVAHNGNAFDNKKANAKFIEFGLPPPAQYQSIDTCLVARRYFNFTSNKLDDLGALLKVGRKVKTGGFDLWLRCMAGETKAWKLMEKYNAQDVKLLERVYLKLRPWITNHPIVAVPGLTACPNCGSEKLKSNGLRRNKLSAFRRYQCLSCGAWSRERVAETDVAKPRIVNG